MPVATKSATVAAAVLAALLAVSAAPRQTASPQPSAPPAQPASAAPNSYVNPAVCATCHAGVAKTFALTGMGRSFTPAAADPHLATFGSKPFFHAPSQTYFAIVRENGKWYERQWQIGYDGKQTNIEQKRIDYVLGSGNHAQTFLHLTARHTLEQLPFGWYSENGGTWGMIPGYDRPDHPDFTRQVEYQCIFCHNGYPTVPSGHDQLGAEPTYDLPLPSGIDCQRCHGPGARHVHLARARASFAAIAAAIVNPAHLGPTRETEICLECHLEPSSLLLPHAVKRADRGTFSYRPGQPLADYRLDFDRAPGKNTRFEINSSAYRLLKSECYLKTQSLDPAHRLQCTTCHDPHNIPRGQAADQHYNAVCRDCHTMSSAGVALAPAVAKADPAAAKPAPHPAATDCISCHMPKRRTADAVQVVMTDHLILSRPPPANLAPKAEYYESRATSYKGPVDLFYPRQLAPSAENQLDLAVAQVRDDSNLAAGIPQLTALIRKYKPKNSAYYVDLAAALHDAGAAARSAAMYREALRHAPGNAGILLAFGRAQLDWRQWTQAAANLRRVTAKTPADPVAWTLLGEALFHQNRNSQARAALNRALALDPTSAEPPNYLGALLIRAGDAAGAEAQFRAAIRLQPNVAAWQSNLAGLLASENKLPEAAFLFQLSLRLDPTATATRLNFGRLLASAGNPTAAAVQAKKAVADAPQNPDAHELMGFVLGESGNTAGAVRELETAIRLRPGFPRAELELAIALRLGGNPAAAIPHLRIAAQSSDPAVRAAARQMLNPSN